MEIELKGVMTLYLNREPFDISEGQAENGELLPFNMKLGEQKLSELVEWEEGEPHLPIYVQFGLMIPAKKLARQLADESATEDSLRAAGLL